MVSSSVFLANHVFVEEFFDLDGFPYAEFMSLCAEVFCYPVVLPAHSMISTRRALRSFREYGHLLGDEDLYFIAAATEKTMKGLLFAMPYRVISCSAVIHKKLIKADKCHSKTSLNFRKFTWF